MVYGYYEHYVCRMTYPISAIDTIVWILYVPRGFAHANSETLELTYHGTHGSYLKVEVH